MINSMPLIYMCSCSDVMFSEMIFLPNCGFQVCKPKSLYTLSHRIVLRLQYRVLSLLMLLLLLFIKSQNFFSNPNVYLFPFLKLYQCNTSYPVDPFNMLSPLINFRILFPIFGKLFITIWYFLLPTSYFKYLSV
uniref:Uncharacterized protein n=1 Tax=Macaca fascicularis TaxID=9541 RepID=Q9GMU9_MACFA|nr:hypothetical protein [Macaca fascicularis]